MASEDLLHFRLVGVYLREDEGSHWRARNGEREVMIERKDCGYFSTENVVLTSGTRVSESSCSGEERQPAFPDCLRSGGSTLPAPASEVYGFTVESGEHGLSCFLLNLGNGESDLKSR